MAATTSTSYIITAIVCSLVTTAAVIVSFATPSWIIFKHNDAQLCACSNCDCGLWMLCSPGASVANSNGDCRWLFSREIEVQKESPGKL